MLICWNSISEYLPPGALYSNIAMIDVMATTSLMTHDHGVVRTDARAR